MRFIPTLRSALVLLPLTLAAQPAAAARWEFQAGRSYMDSYGANTAFIEAVFAPHPIGDTRFSWAPDVSVGWIDGRDVARYNGHRYTTGDSIALLAGGVRLYAGDGDEWSRRFFLALQPVLHTGRTQALSSVYEFATTLGWQGRRFSVQIRHISNASLHEPNRGETMALVGVAF
ncbi:Lipid A 3-O-deacylase (PagL) [Rhodanobacter fulvus Jip2]|uniref:Lipid A 3-O-deacylase (PagL) n=1 Tax=Rhodanobacter fulvus Jip2 TaxID=1163408 RepID=I4VUU5_9GAMM|nr:acyloxyacyl hydrolase [Rhodanobacter fulvus]EIL90986.1 Lipid A 3-O-deacylase (PagL) [Rhodanobacter fulvus Jip2]